MMTPSRRSAALLFRTLPVLFAAVPAFAQDAPPAAVDFARDVLPLLKESCIKCHGPEQQKGKLRFDVRAVAMKGGESGTPAIVPGKSAESRLIVLASGGEPELIMPPKGKGKRLTAKQLGLLKAWIDQGAPWPDEHAGLDVKTEQHWSYVKPLRPPVPYLEDARPSSIQNPQSKIHNPIDAFILSRLETEVLSFSPEAPKEALLRRASLDLTGLPPTPEELDAFLADAGPDAYEKAVDRLLASPHYGERWARPWLDAARYADTNGYEKDLIRSNWAWRDWVIDALNRNMPFDRFTIEQIAGDLLPNPTLEQRIATGFHRNAMLNDEGGIDVEEFRVAAVVDRVDCTATTWLGTTMACAQCHEHKYDPITHKEYFRFYAFFNNTEDSAVKPDPLMHVPNAEQQAALDAIRAEIAAREAALKEAEAKQPEALAAWAATLRAAPPSPGALREGLAVHIGLDETAGDRAEESGGRIPPAVWRGPGAPEWVEGRLGNALRFDGKGGHLDAGDAGNFDRTEPFSAGAWVFWEGGVGTVVARMHEAAAHRGWDLLVGAEGKIQFHLIHDWPSNAVAGSTRATIPAKTWTHVMLVHDGSGKGAGIRVYVNADARPLDVSHDNLSGTTLADVPLHIGLRHAGTPFTGRIDDVRVYRRALSPAEIDGVMAIPFEAAALRPAAQRSEDEQSALAAWFRERRYAEHIRLRGEVAAQRTAESDLLAKVPTTLVMKERAERRPTFILKRGNWDQPADPVEPGVPDCWHPLKSEGPVPTRLDFARWLVDPENPLTARVVMNRFWREIFGRGLVETVEDFGAQGDRPTHPELLDWLAVEFMEKGWDMKAIHRLLVTSATYRQTSAATPDRLEKDPQNRLYARGPRFRVEAEMVRDIALAAGGRLNPRIGGPSVYPPQPPGIWENSFSFYDTKDRWIDATGPDRYRRGLYTFWRRSAPYPTMQTFDVTTRDVCMVKRNRTNTPIQALDLLNDPVFVECAAGLAKRMMTEGGDGADARIAHGFRICTARRPKPGEAKRLAEFHAEARRRFAEDPYAADSLVTRGRVAALGLDRTDLAAWIAVANVLLNLDETLTKG
jgi:hypothetical protein